MVFPSIIFLCFFALVTEVIRNQNSFRPLKCDIGQERNQTFQNPQNLEGNTYKSHAKDLQFFENVCSTHPFLGNLEDVFFQMKEYTKKGENLIFSNCGSNTKEEGDSQEHSESFGGGSCVSSSKTRS